MIVEAQRKMQVYSSKTRPSLVVCEIEHLPFRDRVFEWVSCIRLLGMLPPDARDLVIQELARVSGNFLVFSFYNLLCFIGALKHIAMVVSGKGQEWFPGSRISLTAELEAHGMRELTFGSLIPYITESTIVLAKRIDKAIVKVK